MIFGEIRPGDLFGEFAAISGKPGWASAKTTEPSEALRMPRAAFLALLAELPALSLKLLQKLIELIHSLDKRIVTLSGDDRAANESLRWLFLSTV